MQKKRLVISFITFNIIFIFLQIHKQSYIVGYTYEKQKLAQQYEALLEKKNKLIHELYAQQSHPAIKEYALKKLNMRPLNFNAIKHLPL